MISSLKISKASSLERMRKHSLLMLIFIMFIFIFTDERHAHLLQRGRLGLEKRINSQHSNYLLKMLVPVLEKFFEVKYKVENFRRRSDNQ